MVGKGEEGWVENKWEGEGNTTTEQRGIGTPGHKYMEASI
jgi:hypothetical protein